MIRFAALDAEREQRWAAVEAKMVASRAILCRRGFLIKRRTSSSQTVFTIRFRKRINGRERLSAIYVGDVHLAARARALLFRWREEAITPEQRLQDSILRYCDALAAFRGYSGRARRRLRRAARDAFGDRRALAELGFMLESGGARIRYGKPGGRPAKAGFA